MTSAMTDCGKWTRVLHHWATHTRYLDDSGTLDIGLVKYEFELEQQNSKHFNRD